MSLKLDMTSPRNLIMKAEYGMGLSPQPPQFLNQPDNSAKYRHTEPVAHDNYYMQWDNPLSVDYAGDAMGAYLVDDFL